MIKTKTELYDLVAEDAVIGILLYEPELLTAVGHLSPDCFSEYHRSKAFELIQGQPDDNILITLGEHLEGFDLSRLIDLFMDVANRDIHESDLLTYAQRVRAAKDLRLAGGHKPLDSELMSRYANKQLAGGSLAGELWLDSIMVAPGVDHFKGDYPPEPDHKTCQTYWAMDVYKSEQGHTFKARGVRFRVLHSYIGKGGKVIASCPHCLHNRAIELCKHIERASETYADQNLIRHVTVTDTKARRIAATVKKRNQRDKEGITYSVVKVPQHDGQVWLLHDVPNIEGQPLPVDRGSLFELIQGKVKNTPKGRRGWRGLAQWGKAETIKILEPIGNKPKAKKDPDFVARLLGEKWGKFSTLLQGFLGEDDPITRKGLTFEADLAALLQFLEDAGLNFAVIEGELPDVPLKAYKQSYTCLKRDNAPQQLEFRDDDIPF